jgi:hypothetical protein
VRAAAIARLPWRVLCLGALASLVACSASGKGSELVHGQASEGGAPSGGGGEAGTGEVPGLDGGLGIDAPTSGDGSGPVICEPDKPDYDEDGFEEADGDCNECDANANPGAYDVAGNGLDEDCNGTPDDALIECDTMITNVADADAMNAARAIGLCQTAGPDEKKWGVLWAKWVMADGTSGMNELSHGLVPGFGFAVHPQEGTRILALSSGTARNPTDPGWQSPGGATMNTTSQTPVGFPMDSPSCAIQTANDHAANDPAGLELKIRVPTNAKSFRYDFDFYTWEYPGYVCTQFNDFYVAIQLPPPPQSQSGNVSFDVLGNPVSVNNGFLEVCSPGTFGGKTFPCVKGTGELMGTGFESGGATSWLQTVSPVEPGSEIVLRFAVWDMGDHVLDSTVLIDNLQWSAEEATPTTTPIPNPK